LPCRQKRLREWYSLPGRGLARCDIEKPKDAERGVEWFTCVAGRNVLAVICERVALSVAMRRGEDISNIIS
jgi:hypothetical protein